MPKIWTETVESHRREVRDAILGTTARLVMERGLRGVSMSRIAQETGIGRATLYKYFSDVETILTVWHERQVAAHLEQLAEVRDQASTAEERLAAVLETYALLSFGSRHEHASDVGALLHRSEHMDNAHDQVHRMIVELLTDALRSGSIRDDVPVNELASYCVHALEAASQQRTKTELHRIVAVILTGLHGTERPGRPAAPHPRKAAP